MPAPIVYGAYVVATTAGRIALPILAKEFAKRGGTQFLKTYGRKAFEAVTGGAIGYRVSESIDDTTYKSVTDTPSGLVIGGEKKEPLPPPEPFTTPVDTQGPIILSTPEVEKQDTTLITPEPKKIDTTLSTPIPKESGPIVYTKDDISKQTEELVPEKPDVSEQTKELLGTAKAYKGPIEITDRLSMDLIKDLTKQFHLGDYGTGLEGFKKEQAGDFPRMPHQYKKYMNYVLEDKLIKKYPNIFKQENAGDAVFYMFTPIYSDMANKAYGREVDLGDPSAKELPGIKKIFALDDEGLPLAAASYDTSDKDAYKIMEVGSLHKGSLDMLLATIKKQAIDKNKKYLILEDLSSKESYNAFKARGFKPIPKHLKEKYGGGIVNRPSWRLLKKHVVKSKNLYMPLEHLTEKELLEDLKVDKEMDKLFDQHILSRSYKTSKSIDPKEKRMKGRYFTSIGKK